MSPYVVFYLQLVVCLKITLCKIHNLVFWPVVAEGHRQEFWKKFGHIWKTETLNNFKMLFIAWTNHYQWIFWRPKKKNCVLLFSLQYLQNYANCISNAFPHRFDGEYETGRSQELVFRSGSICWSLFFSEPILYTNWPYPFTE